MLSYKQYREDRTQLLCIEGKKENVNWAIEEILEIVAFLNYSKHQCTYRHQCKFLHYRITTYTLDSQEDISSSPNQSVDFQKSMNPQAPPRTSKPLIHYNRSLR